MGKSSLSALIVAHGWMLPRDGVWLSMSVREVKCKALWAILRIEYSVYNNLPLLGIATAIIQLKMLRLSYIHQAEIVA